MKKSTSFVLFQYKYGSKLQLQVCLTQFDLFQVVTKERDDALNKVKALTAEKNRLQQIGDARVKNFTFI